MSDELKNQISEQTAEEEKTLPEEPAEPVPQPEQPHEPEQPPQQAPQKPEQTEALPKEPKPVPDNLIQLPEDPLIRERRERRKKGLLVLAGALLIAVIVLLFVLFPETFDFDAIRRYFYYMGKRERDSFGMIGFDAAGSNDFAPLGDGMALGTEGGLYYYDLSGNQVSMVQSTVASPRLIANEKLALCYAMGSGYIAIINENGERQMDQTLSGIFLDADLSSDGYICYNLTEDGYKTVATVLNVNHEPIYRYRSSTQYLNACAVSEGGGYLAVAGLTEEDSSFNSTLTILKTDEEIIAGTDQSQSAKRRLDLGNQVVYEMAFLSRNRLCVIAQDALLILDTDCSVIAEMPYDDTYLRGFGISEDGYVVLLLGQSMTGDRYTIRSVDKNGDILGEIEFNRSVRSMDVRGRYIGILTDGELLLYREHLQEYRTSDRTGTAMRVLMRSDGTALLVSNGAAQLYIP